MLPRLIRRGVDEDDHVCRRGGLGAGRRSQSHCGDRQRRFVTLEGFHERHRDAVIGDRSIRHQRQGADDKGDGRRENGLRHGPSRRAGCVMQPRPRGKHIYSPPLPPTPISAGFAHISKIVRGERGGTQGRSRLRDRWPEVLARSSWSGWDLAKRTPKSPGEAMLVCPGVVAILRGSRPFASTAACSPKGMPCRSPRG